jgi:hypothetical protein
MKPKYPNIEVQLSGKDGNAFQIIGRIREAMKREGIDMKEREAFSNEAMSGDYDNVLRTAMRWVSVS